MPRTLSTMYEPDPDIYLQVIDNLPLVFQRTGPSTEQNDLDTASCVQDEAQVSTAIVPHLVSAALTAVFIAVASHLELNEDPEDDPYGPFARMNERIEGKMRDFITKRVEEVQARYREVEEDKASMSGDQTGEEGEDANKVLHHNIIGEVSTPVREAARLATSPALASDHIDSLSTPPRSPSVLSNKQHLHLTTPLARALAGFDSPRTPRTRALLAQLFDSVTTPPPIGNNKTHQSIAIPTSPLVLRRGLRERGHINSRKRTSTLAQMMLPECEDGVVGRDEEDRATCLPSDDMETACRLRGWKMPHSPTLTEANSGHIAPAFDARSMREDRFAGRPPCENLVSSQVPQTPPRLGKLPPSLELTTFTPLSTHVQAIAQHLTTSPTVPSSTTSDTSVAGSSARWYQTGSTVEEQENGVQSVLERPRGVKRGDASLLAQQSDRTAMCNRRGGSIQSTTPPKLNIQLPAVSPFKLEWQSE